MQNDMAARMIGQKDQRLARLAEAARALVGASAALILDTTAANVHAKNLIALAIAENANESEWSEIAQRFAMANPPKSMGNPPKDDPSLKVRGVVATSNDVALIALFEAEDTIPAIISERLYALAPIADDLITTIQNESRDARERKRLLDALRATNDAVIVYDKEDRVVAALQNEDSLYPDLSEIFAPGRHIREIHEEWAKTALNISDDERAEWVARRVRHAPDAPYESYRETSEGRRGIVREAYTSTGARVTKLVNVEAVHEQAETLKRVLNTVEHQNNVLADQAAALEEANKEIAHQANHDALTGLANRRYLEDELQRRCQIAADGGPGLAILHVDLDRFKQINDTLGHAAGDFVLTHVGRVLREETRDGDFIARTGGDEFVLLMETAPDRLAPSRLAGRLIKRLSAPVRFESEICQFGASIGIEIGIAADAACFDPDTLLANADIALYQAKETGRNRFEFFTEEMRVSLESRKRISDDIVAALSTDAFFPVYQPQVDAQTGEIVAVEALARWRHPTRGVLTPSLFLPIANRLALTEQIDERIFHAALRDFTQWEAKGVAPARLGVNVSFRRLHDGGLLETLRATPIPRGRLSFEVLESVFVDELDDHLRMVLDSLVEMGVEIDIDDFGTGHSSLMGLLALAPKRLKIPMELIAPLPDSERHAQLLRFVVAISRSLGVEVVAEGVETEAQRVFLRNAGCDLLQGYLFAEPMPADELAALLSAQRTLSCATSG